VTVSWVAGTTPAFVSGATSISSGAPAGIANGDTLLAAVFGRSALTTPSGWTKVLETAEFNNGSSFQRLAVFSKTAVTTADAGASFTFQQASADRMGLLYAVARGVATVASGSSTADSPDPIEDFPVFDGFEITPASATATLNSSLIVVFGSAIFTAASNTWIAQSGATLFSGGAAANYRLAGSYQARNIGQSNSGAMRFATDNLSPNGLGSITLLLQPSAGSAIQGRASAAGPLRAAAAAGRQFVAARSSAPSPLAAPVALAFHDFSAFVEGLRSFYVMDLTTPGGVVRAPISSWQATLQTGSANYLQCVIPACEPFLEAINAATSFSIYRRALLSDGTVLEYLMARAPVGNTALSRGTSNYTAVVDGYGAAIPADSNPSSSLNRPLRQVRTVFNQASGVRVRCGIDWLLRPAQRAVLESSTFVVSYINYYVTDGDEYMDVGERVQAA
jgi:hypothetical protein